jgi:hypothetical protein
MRGRDEPRDAAAAAAEERLAVGVVSDASSFFLVFDRWNADERCIGTCSREDLAYLARQRGSA